MNNEDIKKLIDIITNSSSNIITLLSSIKDDNNNELNEYSQRLKEQELIIKKIRNSNKQNKEIIQEITTKMEKLNSDNINDKEKVKELSNKINNMNNDNDNYRKKIENYENEIQKLLDKISNIINENKSYRNKIDELNNQIDKLNNQIVKQNDDIKKYKILVKKLQEKLQVHEDDNEKHLRHYGEKEREKSLKIRQDKKNRKKEYIQMYLYTYFNNALQTGYGSNIKIDIKQMIQYIKQNTNVEVSESEIREVSKEVIEKLKGNQYYQMWYNQSQKFVNVR